jgi:hypothetical protein
LICTAGAMAILIALLTLFPTPNHSKATLSVSPSTLFKNPILDAHIVGHNLKSLKGVEVSDCAAACLALSNCLSFDFGGSECYLNELSTFFQYFHSFNVPFSVSVTTAPDSFCTRCGYSYWERLPTLPSPRFAAAKPNKLPSHRQFTPTASPPTCPLQRPPTFKLPPAPARVLPSIPPPMPKITALDFFAPLSFPLPTFTPLKTPLPMINNTFSPIQPICPHRHTPLTLPPQPMCNISTTFDQPIKNHTPSTPWCPYSRLLAPRGRYSPIHTPKPTCQVTQNTPRRIFNHFHVPLRRFKRRIRPYRSTPPPQCPSKVPFPLTAAPTQLPPTQIPSKLQHPPKIIDAPFLARPSVRLDPVSIMPLPAGVLYDFEYSTLPAKWTDLVRRSDCVMEKQKIENKEEETVNHADCGAFFRLIFALASIVAVSALVSRAEECERACVYLVRLWNEAVEELKASTESWGQLRLSILDSEELFFPWKRDKQKEEQDDGFVHVGEPSDEFVLLSHAAAPVAEPSSPGDDEFEIVE